MQIGVTNGTIHCKNAVGSWERASSTLRTNRGDELKVKPKLYFPNQASDVGGIKTMTELRKRSA